MKNTLYLPLLLTVTVTACTQTKNVSEAQPPNILWVSSEDITTLLGCYGDTNASTPHLDAFAKRSVLFSNAFATAPCCAPSRSTIVTGINAITLGTQRLRSEISIPDDIKAFPKYLKEAGYYVSNNSKEDYNFRDSTIWDMSSGKAHWRLRDEGQAFFSVFNLGPTHQSQIFGSDSAYAAKIKRFLPYIQTCSPETLILPPYYPNTPEIRKLWARYYTNVSILDYQFSQIIKELEDDNLAENTIVVFFADHGTGVPRGKRSLYDSGMKIPLLAHVPQKYAGKYGMMPGTVDSRMVTFIDFAPSMLQIAGLDIPATWQGKAFIPGDKNNQHAYVFGASDRIDENFDVARMIRSPKFLYIRNFLPFLPLIQPNFYTDQSEIMQELLRVNRETELKGPELIMFNPRRTAEELYDTEKDPHQINNLAGKEEYKEIVEEMRNTLLAEVKKNYDTGLMPEPEMLRLSAGKTPYEIAHDSEIFPIDEILAACNLMLEPELTPGEVMNKLQHPNGFVRYWTVIAVQERGFNNEDVIAELKKLKNDNFPTVQIEAAKTLIKLGDKESVKTIVPYIEGPDAVLSLYASRAFQEVSGRLSEKPESVYNYYQKLKISMNDRKNHSEHYKLYSFWALYSVYEQNKSVFR